MLTSFNKFSLKTESGIIDTFSIINRKVNHIPIQYLISTVDKFR